SNADTGGGPSGKTINDHHFGAFTVEASVNLRTVAAGTYENIVGKDGKPTAQAIAPFQMKQRGDGNLPLQLEFLDGAGNPQSILSTFTPQTGKWYHLAATSDGTT